MFTDPVKNLRAFGIREDAVVADLGAGTGFYSVAAGHMAPKGKVYAVEIVKDFLMTIKNKVRDARLNNVPRALDSVPRIQVNSLSCCLNSTTALAVGIYIRGTSVVLYTTYF